MSVITPVKGHHDALKMYQRLSREVYSGNEGSSASFRGEICSFSVCQVFLIGSNWASTIEPLFSLLLCGVATRSKISSHISCFGAMKSYGI